MAISPLTISRLRPNTPAMSRAREPVSIPSRSAWRTRSATLALQISFLLGRQLVFGQEPPINLRSTTAVRCPDLAMCHARNFPPSPLPRMSISTCSAWDIFDSFSDKMALAVGCHEKLDHRFYRLNHIEGSALNQAPFSELIGPLMSMRIPRQTTDVSREK